MANKFALLFPGQGSQYVGMGYSLAHKFNDFLPILEETLKEADATIGFPISSVIKDGPADKLKQTEITQPALLTISIAMGRWLKSNIKVQPSLALGHSLGEYSAYVFSEAIRFTDAVKLVRYRGEIMQAEVPSGEGGMGALMGATIESADSLCKAVQKSTGLILELSLINSQTQIVISGHAKAISKAQEMAKDYAIRKVIPLDVSGPFHCSLLQGAGTKLRAKLDETSLSEPTIPIISNVSANEIESSEEIKLNLEKQVFKPVLWKDSIERAAQREINIFIEVGAGTVLTGLVKKILPRAHAIAMDELESWDQINKLILAP